MTLPYEGHGRPARATWRVPSGSGPKFGARTTGDGSTVGAGSTFLRRLLQAGIGSRREIAYADQALHRLLDVLRQRDRFDKTLILFTADHGESMGEHVLYFQHGGDERLGRFEPAALPTDELDVVRSRRVGPPLRDFPQKNRNNRSFRSSDAAI